MKDLQKEMRERVSQQITLHEEGKGRFRVFTPFRFPDGDHLAIVLKRNGNTWDLSDEGHTLMHLTYEIDEKDLRKGTRAKIISSALNDFGIEDRSGELLMTISEADIGNALFDFVQGLLKVTDVAFLRRERVRAAFMEDFESFLERTLPADRRTFQWADPIHDPQRRYVVDCKVNGMAKPLFIFALQNDTKVRDTTITLQQYEKWRVPFRAIGIFENQEEVSRKVLSRFSDVCDKQFSNLAENKDRITGFLNEAIQA